MKSLLKTVCSSLIAVVAILPQAHADTLNYTVINAPKIAIQTATNRVIRTQNEMEVYYRSINGGVLPKLPTINFNTQQLVIVALGTKPTGGHNVLVSSVNESLSVVQVYAVRISPDNTCMVTQALTYPAAVFIMSKKAKPVQFSFSNAYYRCN